MHTESLHWPAPQAYPTKPREQWLLDWPGQVVIAVGQVFWTRAVNDAVTSGGTFGLQQLVEANTKVCGW